MTKIPFMDLHQTHGEVVDDIFADLRELVKKGDFIGGPRVTTFEQEFARFSGAHACAGISNGTEAIRLGLLALGIGRGDEVITVANTFIATAEAIVDLGARPVLVDAEASTALMDLKAVEAAITPRTKAVIAVQLYGNVLDLDQLSDLCRRKKLFLIQDAAQAHGALWGGKPLGAYGDLQTYSFYPGKNLGAWGDAGALTGNSESLVSDVRALANHGRKPGSKYLHDLASGCNGRLDPVQALVLSHKLKLMPDQLKKRRDLHRQFREALRGVGDLELFENGTKADPATHLFVVKTSQRDALQAHLNRDGIQTGVHYPVPLHLQPALKSLGYRSGDFPVAEKLALTSLSLPFFPGMQADQLERVVKSAKTFFEGH